MKVLDDRQKLESIIWGLLARLQERDREVEGERVFFAAQLKNYWTMSGQPEQWRLERAVDFVLANPMGAPEQTEEQ